MRNRLFIALLAVALVSSAVLAAAAGPAGALTVDTHAAASPYATAGLVPLARRPTGLLPGVERRALRRHRHGARAGRRHAHLSHHHRRRHELPGGVFRYSPRYDPASQPLMAVVGASFSVGVGAGSHRLAWPEDLARLLNWRLVVAADPGAGFLNPGTAHLGPFSQLLKRLHLARTRPRLVIIQGGHDDIGWRPSEEKVQVERLIRTIEREDPGGEIAVVSVFSAHLDPRPRAWAIDRAVVAGARAADPEVLIFNPIKSRWHYPKHRGHLHPTRAGYRWLARRMAGVLQRSGQIGGGAVFSELRVY